ncbi:MAG TPA: hypothetical protein VJU60_13655 [Thermoleophilaceae bacterium]|nr:hypothetical protein [Thermoleophilaceae bacterium]
MPLHPLAVQAGKQLSLQSRIRARRQLEVLPSRIEKDEQLLHVATSSRGLVAATDRRLIVVRGADDVQEVAYSRIVSFVAAKDRRKPYIQLQTDSSELEVKGLGEGFEDICRVVHARMWDVTLQRAAEPASVEPIRRAAGAA